MAVPARIFISCSQERIDLGWLDSVRKAWAPLQQSGICEFLSRDQVGDAIDFSLFHGAVLLVTQNYLANAGLMSGEFQRLLKYRDAGLGFFWILIDDAMWKFTPLGSLNIQWAQKTSGPIAAERPRFKVQKALTEIGEEIAEWWTLNNIRLAPILQDCLSGGRPVITPRPLAIPAIAPLRSEKRGRRDQIWLLPCLINRNPQESAIQKQIMRRQPATGDISAFIIPGPRRESPDRFAMRIKEYTLDQIRALPGFTGNLGFCRVAWPPASASDDGNAGKIGTYFAEYVDNVFKSLRSLNPSEFTGDFDLFEKSAASALVDVMAGARVVLWSEITVSNPGATGRELLARCLSWWQRFPALLSSATDGPRPIAVFVINNDNAGMAAYLKDSPTAPGIRLLDELSSIVLQDVENWLQDQRVVKYVDPDLIRTRSFELYKNAGNRPFPFSEIEKSIVSWLEEAVS